MFDNVEINIPGGLDFTIPKMVKVKQNFEDHKIEDVGQAVKNEIIKTEIKNSIVSGSSIAIGVGSRGVANIAIAVKALVESLIDLGAKPFFLGALEHDSYTVATSVLPYIFSLHFLLLVFFRLFLDLYFHGIVQLSSSIYFFRKKI